MNNSETRTKIGKVTAGPWVVEKYERSTVAMAGQCVIIAPAPDGAPYSEQIANAALISASPDLLAAMKATLALWNKHGLGDDAEVSDAVYAQVRRAIDKAEGRA